MTIEERLEAFHEENKPFYLVDHDDGSFSLCFPISFLPDEEFERFQAPFDSYATARGIPISAPNGLRNYGNGYDWQAVFQEAFKNDPNIESIKFDCEAGGFFCYCDNLDVIESFGKRFSVLCRNSEQFVPIVAEGLRNAEICAAEAEAEERQLLKTVRGQLMAHPYNTFEIMSPLGEIRVTPDMTEKLLASEMPTVQIGGVQYADYELLDQPIKGQQTDIFNDNLIRMKTDEAPEPVFGEIKM